MKVGSIIALVLVLFASHPVHAVSRELEGRAHVESKHYEPAAMEINYYENTRMVTNAPIGSKLEIYSVVGIKVKEIEIKQSTAEYTLNIAKGYYIIRIADTVRKVAIR